MTPLPSATAERCIANPYPVPGSRDLRIAVDPPDGPQVAALLREHLDEMHRISPPESVHALDLQRLRAAHITFWSAWRGAALIGCAALKALGRGHGEVKSMRTAPAFRGQGVAAALLHTLVGEAIARGYRRLSLETGTQPEFAAARALYARFGSSDCAPFADVADSCSAHMTRSLAGPHNGNTQA